MLLSDYYVAPLHDHLQLHAIEYLQFAFRWINNLLMREFPLLLAVRLWDTYLVSCNVLIFKLIFKVLPTSDNIIMCIIMKILSNTSCITLLCVITNIAHYCIKIINCLGTYTSYEYNYNQILLLTGGFKVWVARPRMSLCWPPCLPFSYRLNHKCLFFTV